MTKPVKPLYACAQAVAVKCNKGAWLQVEADSGNGFVGISPLVWADSSSMKVDISPYLTIPQKVRVRQIACGGTDTTSAPAVAVLSHPKLMPLIPSFLVAGMSALPVPDAVPGAEVTVWSSDSNGNNPQMIGRSVVVPGNPFVPLNRPLTTADHVWMVQTMCGQVSDREGMAPVLPATKTFQISHPISFPSDMNPSHPVVVQSAKMVCAFTGAWHFTAGVANEETRADCSFILGFDMQLPTPLVFGETLKRDLAAAPPGLPQRFASQGIPSSKNFSESGTYSDFSNPAFWQAVLNAPSSLKFNFLPTFKDYQSQ